MSKVRFTTNAAGTPVAIETKGRKSYEKRIEKLSAKVAELAAKKDEARSTAGALRFKLAEAERARAAAPAPAAPPPPAAPPAPTHRQIYRELKATNPYAASQYLLNHLHEFEASADAPGAA